MRKMLVIASLAALASAAAAAAEKPAKTEDILRGYVEDYKMDHMAIDAVFGVKVGDEWWNVSVARKEEDYAYKEKFTFQNFGPHDVTLAKGKPRQPTWYVEFADKSVLDQVSSGALTVVTGAMKSFGSDRTMVEIRDMEGFTSNAGATAETYHTLSHFFSTGTPEITTFERDKALPTHGASAVALYTMKDKRVVWISLGKDEVANSDERLEFGQVPNLFIFTKGKGKADFGQGPIDVHAGMSVFVAPYVKHVFINPNDEPLEGILILFGDNSDFAYGKSYMDAIEEQYEFLGAAEPKPQ